MQLILVGADDQILTLEADESPVDAFPCMSSGPIHQDARMQLYSLVTGTFFEDATLLEPLFHSLTEEGPFVHRLDPSLLTQLAGLDEDDIERLAALWAECREVEDLDLQMDDLYEFLFQFIHFCRTAANESDFGLFIYGDD